MEAVRIWAKHPKIAQWGGLETGWRSGVTYHRKELRWKGTVDCQCVPTLWAPVLAFGKSGCHVPIKYASLSIFRSRRL